MVLRGPILDFSDEAIRFRLGAFELLRPDVMPAPLDPNVKDWN